MIMEHRAKMASALAIVCALIVPAAHAADPPPTVGALTGITPPVPPARQYNALIKNKSWLVALGKALFWDVATGSDGVACASCHFNAGADPRIKNQMDPGLRAKPLGDTVFGGAGGLMASGTPAGPNITLQAADFPFHQLTDPLDRESDVLFDENDVVSSQGALKGAFVGLRYVNTKARRRDLCNVSDNTIFQINIGGVAKAVPKVEPRNTPTAVNAAYFYRNFWDGRANNSFNGVNPFGNRARNDPKARIVTYDGAGFTPKFLELPNSSLASQAVGPPLSDLEMSCAGRGFRDLGRKLLSLRALGTQKIAATDSVFGVGSSIRLANMVRATGTGLKYTYLELVQKAFKDNLWAGPGTFVLDPTGTSVVATPTPDGYSQAESNFSLFFGLAVEAYERTLISDQTPFDQFENGAGDALTAQEQAGLALFQGKGKCVDCHTGPVFSGAAVPPRQREELIESMVMGDGGTALYDGGFYNIGVRPTFEDIGVGNIDDYGNPLSFTRQFTSGNRVDQFPDPANPVDRVAVDGAFKVPTLRNIGMTAPYFHNGGTSNLRDVVRFYNRGGDRRSVSGGDTTGTGTLGQTTPDQIRPAMGGSNLDPDIDSLNLSDEEIDALVAFLKTLTDERVRCHAAPFDHPELIVTNGALPIALRDRAKPEKLRLIEVGREGYAGRGWCDPNSGDLFGRQLIGGMLQPVP